MRKKNDRFHQDQRFLEYLRARICRMARQNILLRQNLASRDFTSEVAHYLIQNATVNVNVFAVRPFSERVYSNEKDRITRPRGKTSEIARAGEENTSATRENIPGE